MSTGLHEQGIVTIHDEVVSLVAQRFYLFVPRGIKESPQKLAGDACIPLSGIYEYTFVSGR
jgi:hypothetical protein